MAEDSQNGICARIAELRLKLEGPRGKSVFANKLGISASTYNYYESNRVPPADVLVRIADLANVDLRWLLTGQSGPTAVLADHPAVVRAAELLANRPDAAGPLTAFVELLAASMEFPAKDEQAAPLPAPDSPAPMTEAIPESPSPVDIDRADWIPVLGRSAAGLPQFWRDGKEPPGLTTLAQRIDARRSIRTRVKPATVAPSDSPEPLQGPVQLITLTGPDGDNVAEFICAPGIKARHPDAFALRIDGESMAPDIRHGNLVVLSPSVAAADGKCAVVQLAGQIGVTCKLYRRQGDRVHLVPINEQYPPQSFPADKVQWSLAVLAKVRG
jgi:SOS-response transcriptional repressor LexA/transcriptional regulator with XRE-family HTH domain